MFTKANLAIVLLALAGIMFFVAGIVDYARSSEFDVKFVGFGILFLGLSGFYYWKARSRMQNKNG